MSQARKDALRPTLPSNVAEYSDACDRVLEAKIKAQREAADHQIAQLKAEIAQLKGDLIEQKTLLERIRYEDRFGLTKAKIIRFMKDEGYL